MPGRSMIMTNITCHFDGFNLHSLNTHISPYMTNLALDTDPNLHNCFSTFPLLNHTYFFRVQHYISYRPIKVLKVWRQIETANPLLVHQYLIGNASFNNYLLLLFPSVIPGSERMIHFYCGREISNKETDFSIRVFCWWRG